MPAIPQGQRRVGFPHHKQMMDIQEQCSPFPAIFPRGPLPSCCETWRHEQYNKIIYTY